MRFRSYGRFGHSKRHLRCISGLYYTYSYCGNLVFSDDSTPTPRPGISQPLCISGRHSGGSRLRIPVRSSAVGIRSVQTRPCLEQRLGLCAMVCIHIMVSLITLSSNQGHIFMCPSLKHVFVLQKNGNNMTPQSHSLLFLAS